MMELYYTIPEYTQMKNPTSANTVVKGSEVAVPCRGIETCIPVRKCTVVCTVTKHFLIDQPGIRTQEHICASEKSFTMYSVKDYFLIRLLYQNIDRKEALT